MMRMGGDGWMEIGIGWIDIENEEDEDEGDKVTNKK